ncbi:MAG: hypothetical protein BLM47_11875 [Candidatus Reconcilbacillus cellulovorans]|uniref:Calcineurin-like phosphoesterase domain-containing protein n=1 Tax=Candidatus Reconcilbacillus cellulovorans TaxID=1906605 RepID=A0A2A6DXY8_9BACL|nr:MAG: hypothetical protein BLM47_11875 [Candidatus Reconcilbacillus cellulovorans]
MKPFRFVHAADLHLDSPFSGVGPLPERLRERVFRSTFRAWDRIVALAIERQADAVLLAGDVFDSAERSLRARLRFLRGLERLADRGVPVFVVCGNHDPLETVRGGLSWPDNVVVFGADRAEEVPVDRPGRGTVATVHGVSFAAPAVTDNLARLFSRGRLDVCQVGLLHANVDGQPGHDPYAPCRLSDLLAARLDYWALGHIHDRRVLWEGPPIVYPGNPQGRNVKETGAKGCYWVEADESGQMTLSFCPTDDVRWFDVAVPLDGVSSLAGLRERLRERLNAVREEADGRGAIVRLTLTGRTSLYRELAETAFLEEWLADAQEREAESAAASELDGGPFVWPAEVRLEAEAALDRERLKAGGAFSGELLRLAEQWAALPDLADRLARGPLAPLADGRASLFLRGWGAEHFRELVRAASELAVSLLEEGADDGEGADG